MEIENLGIRWTCFICHEIAPDHSLHSLQTQEKSGKTLIFVDGNYCIYLRCPYCKLAFHPRCCSYEIEPVLTKEWTATICQVCASKETCYKHQANRSRLTDNSVGLSTKRI